ncbi:MAG: 50S ribosomal protein L10 [Deltaproteobacteria bacterium]|nr:50S ribosomal protein L10 [Deltaproteobacteria bacterium]
MITREEKKATVAEFHEKFAKAQAAFVASYQGIKVEQITTLRSSLRKAGVELKVLRNTLARLAVKGTPYEGLSGHFKGPMAVAISYKDAAAAAKALTEFIKDQPVFALKGGALGTKMLTVAEVKVLSELPSKEQMLAIFLGGLKSVPTGLAVALSGVPRKLLYALNAVKSSKEGAAA